MNAFGLLTNVSQVYRNLASLAVDARVITESGDVRCDFFRWARPDRFRIGMAGVAAWCMWLTAARCIAFPYEPIDQQVVSAEVIRGEDGCHVVATTYEESSRPNLTMAPTPVLFWVDQESFLVQSFRQEVGHRIPAELK